MYVYVLKKSEKSWQQLSFQFPVVKKLRTYINSFKVIQQYLLNPFILRKTD